MRACFVCVLCVRACCVYFLHTTLWFGVPRPENQIEKHAFCLKKGPVHSDTPKVHQQGMRIIFLYSGHALAEHPREKCTLARTRKHQDTQYKNKGENMGDFHFSRSSAVGSNASPRAFVFVNLLLRAENRRTKTERIDETVTQMI